MIAAHLRPIGESAAADAVSVAASFLQTPISGAVARVLASIVPAGSDGFGHDRQICSARFRSAVAKPGSGHRPGARRAQTRAIWCFGKAMSDSWRMRRRCCMPRERRCRSHGNRCKPPSSELPGSTVRQPAIAGPEPLGPPGHRFSIPGFAVDQIEQRFAAIMGVHLRHHRPDKRGRHRGRRRMRCDRHPGMSPERAFRRMERFFWNTSSVTADNRP
jgi:hypothetical protein